MFRNKTLLITGGTGSFGNAVLKRFLDTDVAEIRIFSRDEKKQDDMRKTYLNSKIKFYLGDVRDKSSVDSAMYSVDYVFHAAALKQVPSCEFFPIEAVKTNVMGTDNVLTSAIQHSVKKVVVLSTDKAVYPINAMGMSKALMEKVMVAKSRVANSTTVLCGTRYGNVMASRGSVIPLFVKQIKRGEAVTVTDPEMTRFMMTLDDAVDLVLYAYEHGQQGDIFVQKAPATTVGELAKALIRMYGKKSKVKVIGTRHGEKLFESLINREEIIKAIDLGGYYRIPADNRDLNYEKYISEGENSIAGIEDYTSQNTHQLNNQELIEMLMRIESVQSDIEWHA